MQLSNKVYVVVQIFLWLEHFQTSLILFSFVPVYGNEAVMNEAGFKIFKPKKNLNCNIYIVDVEIAALQIVTEV